MISDNAMRAAADYLTSIGQSGSAQQLLNNNKFRLTAQAFADFERAIKNG